ncbi:MAG: polymorphic toxin-type HINT domain-containing protein, partial [Bdellovibrionia bacterium]
DNWQRELVEKKAARLAQQEIDIAAFAEIHEQRHAALVIRNEERTARELAQKEAADKAKILSRNAEVSRRSASIAAQQAKADSVTTKAVAALCFTGETQISISPEESAPIASIKVGDYVETCDVNSFICERLRVTSVTRNIATHILNLNINGEITRVTNSHPYYSVSRSKWVKASELAEGEMLRTLSGETAALNGVSDEYGHFYVYNFEVEKNHNYYANGILVHNCTIGVVTAEAVGMAGLSTLVASALVTNYIVDKVTDFAARVHDIIR